MRGRSTGTPVAARCSCGMRVIVHHDCWAQGRADVWVKHGSLRDMSSRLQHLVRLPRRVLSLLVHRSGRIEQLTIDTRHVSKLATESAKTTSEIGKRVRKLDGEVGSLTKDIRVLTSELREIRGELKDRLLQYNLQLGRLSR